MDELSIINKKNLPIYGMAFWAILTSTLLAYCFNIPKLMLLWLFMLIGMGYLSGMFFLVTSYKITLNCSFALQHGFKEDSSMFKENFFNISYSDIEVIGIKRNPLFFFKKCLILKPHNIRFKRIYIPINLNNFDKFYDVLKEKIIT